MSKELHEILEAAKDVAGRFKKLTGKPLGITGEIAEFSAAKLLNLKLAEARQAGYDAIDGAGRKVQIKGRCLPEKPGPGQRLGSIRLDHEWDTVLLVLLDEMFEVIEMWEAERPVVEEAILAPGSKARNERGALAVRKFKQIGTKVWPADKA
ncbi:DUF6998 domain-containing protein [Billgrantia montanilacus]|uniref:DUF6998 domain-containing protein n=1 Tax=Billgrantia montanilacus TaxID=2282305 RepID=A0A368TPK0_9GAMM|nr:hypothetical protein [Halomonas montanilacus]RCV86500.1 hypothetical protein DU505_20650 [Halomonas montanilacus]